MEKVSIGGKEYDVEMSWLTYKKIMAYAELPEELEINQRADAIGERMIDTLWSCLIPRLGFKPFIFKWRMKRRLQAREVMDADGVLAKLMTMEDKKGGN